ncbi:hypothetical protein [Neptuniibacter sp. QD48_11]
MTLSYKRKNKLKPTTAEEKAENLGQAVSTLCDPDNKAWCEACKDLLLQDKLVDGACAFRKQSTEN